jgi:hypothetical protein
MLWPVVESAAWAAYKPVLPMLRRDMVAVLSIFYVVDGRIRQNFIAC